MAWGKSYSAIFHGSFLRAGRIEAAPIFMALPVRIASGGGLRRWHCPLGISELIIRGPSPLPTSYPVVSGYVERTERAYIRMSFEIITSCTPAILRVTAESPVPRFVVPLIPMASAERTVKIRTYGDNGSKCCT